MKKITKIAVAAAMLSAVPAAVQAGGIGLYVPYTLSHSADLTYDAYSIATQEHPKEDIEYKYSGSGIGFVYDSNLDDKKSNINWRTGFEYVKMEWDSADGRSIDAKAADIKRYSIVETMGFRIWNNDMFRIWAGPRISLFYQTVKSSPGYSYGYEDSSLGANVAGVLGMNMNIGEHFTLSADVDYSAGFVTGGWEWDLSDETENFTGTENGATLKVYALWRFGK